MTPGSALQVNWCDIVGGIGVFGNHTVTAFEIVDLTNRAAHIAMAKSQDKA